MENIQQNSLSSMLSKSFSKMALGLGITALTSVLLYFSGVYYAIITAIPYISLMLLLVQILLTFCMSKSLGKNSSSSGMMTMFTIYSILMGFTMTGLGYAYSLGQISIAFVVSMIYFVCLAIIGKTTNKDLSQIGVICSVGLFAMIVIQLILALLGTSLDVRLWSIIGLLIFTGITAWDVQKIARTDISFNEEKFAIFFALELYLDFINIFIHILQLLGYKKN